MFLLIALACAALSSPACGKLAPGTGGEGAWEKNAGEDGAGEESEASGGKPAACAQLTKEEVEAALGKAVTEPVRGEELVSRRAGTRTSSCMFVVDQGFVSLNVRHRDPRATNAWSAAQSFDELRDLIVRGRDGNSSARLEKVSGLGADAFAETKEETVNYETTELRVLGSRAILTVRVNGPSSTPTLETAKILAEKAISRLERYAWEEPATRPRAAAEPDGRERPETEKRPQAESRSAKRVEQSPAPKEAVTRRSRETATKSSAKSGRTAASGRSAERDKRETRKTSRPNVRKRGR